MANKKPIPLSQLAEKDIITSHGDNDENTAKKTQSFEIYLHLKLAKMVQRIVYHLFGSKPLSGTIINFPFDLYCCETRSSHRYKW